MKSLIFIIILIAAISCNTPLSVHMDKLKQLDNQLNENPTLVADGLKTINIEKLTQEELAYFYLLDASAKDKNETTIESDSSLLVAEQFYKKQEDYYNLARTQYYLAIYLTNKETHEAFDLFKQAELNIKRSSTPEPYFTGLIYSRLGDLSYEQYNLEEAEKYYQAARQYFYDVPDSITACYPMISLYWIYVWQENSEKAKQVLDEAEHLLETTSDTSKKRAQLKSNILDILSYTQLSLGNHEEALRYAKESLTLLEASQGGIHSSDFSNIIKIYENKGQLDSMEYYVQKMLEGSSKEGELLSIATCYQQLIHIREEQGYYQEACTLKDKYILLLDSINLQLKFEKVIELEKKYNYAEKERQYLQAKNKNLVLYIFLLLFGIVAALVTLYYNWRHRKLKKKNQLLTEEIRHTQWGYELIKELTAENTNDYEELERILNRNAPTIPPKVYSDIKLCLNAQKGEYSKRLFSALTNVEKQFIEALYQKDPKLGADEVMLAYMLRHRWKINDIAKVLLTTPDALKKRKSRLKTKLLGKENVAADLEEFLKNL